MLNSRFMEARMFKELPGGFIFQLPPPTIFTPTDAVIVTPTQKEEILAITPSGSPMARRLFFWSAVAAGILAGRASGHIEDMPVAGSIFIGFAAGLLTLLAATISIMLRKRAVLRPLLEPLPRSAELLFPIGLKASWTDFRWVRRRAAHG